MKITRFSYRLTRVGGGFAAALLVVGLQLSLVALPIGSLLADGENEARNAFTWRNLQSDIAGVADRTDPNLVNSWGLTINTTANVFWIADNGAG
ncbi:MAG: TIGR03118 family protein, partial [Verrucomicrobia bacterium]|nr:TIGR03118 family protein [Verrucomicrobiota bacterium]